MFGKVCTDLSRLQKRLLYAAFLSKGPVLRKDCEKAVFYAACILLFTVVFA